MSSASEPINWKEVVGWSDEQIQDIRILAHSFIRNGKFESACKIIEALLPIDNRRLIDIQTLGALYLDLDNPEKALSYIHQAIQQDPHHLGTRLNQVNALLALGQISAAMKIAQKLASCPDPKIAGQASAFLLAYQVGYSPSS